MISQVSYSCRAVTLRGRGVGGGMGCEKSTGVGVGAGGVVGCRV